MPEPQTNPHEHDVPTFQPGDPTPDDPRKDAPIKDPPRHEEHDIERAPRQAGPDEGRVLYDENRAPG